MQRLSREIIGACAWRGGIFAISRKGCRPKAGPSDNTASSTELPRRQHEPVPCRLAMPSLRIATACLHFPISRCDSRAIQLRWHAATKALGRGSPRSFLSIVDAILRPAGTDKRRFSKIHQPVLICCQPFSTICGDKAARAPPQGIPGRTANTGANAQWAARLDECLIAACNRAAERIKECCCLGRRVTKTDPQEWISIQRG